MVKVILEVHEGEHMSPTSYRYEPGTFSKLNKCDDCGIVGLPINMHVVDVCVQCGGTVREYKAGKWDKTQGWMIRTGIEK